MCMRTREEIVKAVTPVYDGHTGAYPPENIDSVKVELLLDIRDLLANPPVEIAGQDIDAGFTINKNT